MRNNASNMEDLKVSGTPGQPPSLASANLDPGGGTTPVPVALIDRVMPTLRDTELRVLLVVVRQTLGWQVGKDPYLRKERDWLTQSQLMRRTAGERGGGACRGRAGADDARRAATLPGAAVLPAAQTRGKGSKGRRSKGRIWRKQTGEGEINNGEIGSGQKRTRKTTYNKRNPTQK